MVLKPWRCQTCPGRASHKASEKCNRTQPSILLLLSLIQYNMCLKWNVWLKSSLDGLLHDTRYSHTMSGLTYGTRYMTTYRALRTPHATGRHTGTYAQHTLQDAVQGLTHSTRYRTPYRALLTAHATGIPYRDLRMAHAKNMPCGAYTWHTAQVVQDHRAAV